jgi:uncharacterized metal-binding protein
MPSGKTHTKINLISLPVILTPLALLYPIHVEMILLFASGFLFGTYLLTPDLDTDSDCYNNWGVFRFIWYPYKRFIPHRSILSHGLILGDIIRILYLCIVLFPFVSILSDTPFLILIEEYRFSLLILLSGVVVASSLHILLDTFYKPKRRKR